MEIQCGVSPSSQSAVSDSSLSGPYNKLIALLGKHPNIKLVLDPCMVNYVLGL